MELLQTNTLQSAREKLLNYLMGKYAKKTVKLMDAEGQVLAEDIRSISPIPHFRRSTVDGYAVISRDTQGVSESIPAFLKNIEEIRIGHEAASVLKSGQCAYVPTGGMVPDGADAVVMVEYCEPFSAESIAVYDSVSVGRNVVNIGEDVESNAVILKKGTTLHPQEIGALASAGISQVSIYEPLKLTIISTGDELVSLDKVPALGQVRDINTYALESLAKKNGFDVVSTYVLMDEEELLKSAVLDSMQTSDMVVISGGSSQGKKDMTAGVLDELSEPGVFIHGISIKPGKPTILGYDTKSSTALIGLPGHPVAAMIIFELLAVWVKNRLIGKNEGKYIYAKMKTNVGSAPGKTTCQMIRLSDFEGEYFAEPIFGKSGLMSTLITANGYTLIDMNKEGLQKDEIVKVFLI
jgi:molybdopterin molybdotransferase